MADQNEEQDLDDLDEDEEETEDETEESEESEESEKPKPKVDKRISDLQSKADAAEARANKAEKLLAKVRGQETDQGGKDPETAALRAELREASLDAVFGEYPVLAEFDIDRDLIEGSNRAEMRESATSLVALIKSVSTKARNKALRDNGITAEPAGSRREPPKNYGAMSQEDFEKELDRVKSGGGPSW